VGPPNLSKKNNCRFEFNHADQNDVAMVGVGFEKSCAAAPQWIRPPGLFANIMTDSFSYDFSGELEGPQFEKNFGIFVTRLKKMIGARPPAAPSNPNSAPRAPAPKLPRLSGTKADPGIAYVPTALPTVGPYELPVPETTTRSASPKAA
jgi:hypothetical protein